MQQIVGVGVMLGVDESEQFQESSGWLLDRAAGASNSRLGSAASSRGGAGR
jgi:hypothetical protein